MSYKSLICIASLQTRLWGLRPQNRGERGVSLHQSLEEEEEEEEEEEDPFKCAKVWIMENKKTKLIMKLISFTR